MSDTKEQASGGVGFLTLLGLLFIGLKLGGVIDWSWLWVLCPLWAPVAVVAAFVLVVVAILGIWTAILVVLELIK